MAATRKTRPGKRDTKKPGRQPSRRGTTVSNPRGDRQPKRTGDRAVGRALPELGADLTPAQLVFIEAYRSNGHNATKAYRAAYPGVTYQTAMANGSRMLRNAKVWPVLREEMRRAWKAMKVEGDEALALMSMEARADIRMLYGEDGALLPVKDWPDEVALCIIKYDESKGAVTFTNKQAARRILAEHAGVLQSDSEKGALTLAKILAGTFTKDEDVDEAD